MKKAVSKTRSVKEDMRPEYDFSSMKGAVRGKYCEAYRAGHKVERIELLQEIQTSINQVEGGHGLDHSAAKATVLKRIKK